MTRALIGGSALALVALIATLSIVLRTRQPADGLKPENHTDRVSESTRAGKTQQIGENHWVVSRIEKEAYLSDLASVSKHVLLKPSVDEEDSSVTHLTIIKLAEESPMHRAGFRKGDEILAVNGAPMTTMDRSVNLVHEVRKSDDLTVQIKRGNTAIRYKFEFR